MAEHRAKAVYTISELADCTGVTPRTVRLYVQRRLIPPAYPGRYAHDPRYGREHLEALRRVRAIRESNLSLDDIRDRLYPEEDE